MQRQASPHGSIELVESFREAFSLGFLYRPMPSNASANAKEGASREQSKQKAGCKQNILLIIVQIAPKFTYCLYCFNYLFHNLVPWSPMPAPIHIIGRSSLFKTTGLSLKLLWYFLLQCPSVRFLKLKFQKMLKHAICVLNSSTSF